MNEESRLVAVSIRSMVRAPYMMPDGSLAQRAVIGGDSSSTGLSFIIETGLLNAQQIERCEALKKHGFTVVEAPSDWRYGYNDPGGWQEVLIQQALKQIGAILEQNDGEHAMSGYDAQLAQAVLEAVYKSFPKQLSMTELKHELNPEPSDPALLTAIDALLIERLIEGPHIRSGIYDELRDVAYIRITSDGRKHLLNKAQPSASSNGPVFHGDQIINYGQAGAIGRGSQGVVNVHDRWKEIGANIDLQELAVELDRLRVEYRNVASSREEDRQVALLGDAAEEAEKGNGPSVATILSKVGKSVLNVARDIGTDVAAKVIAELITTN
jgi:hypothetical protein